MLQNPTHWRSAVSLRLYFSLRERMSLFSLDISIKMVGFKNYLLWILNDSVSCPEVSCVLCAWSCKHIWWVAASDSSKHSTHTAREPSGASLLAWDPSMKLANKMSVIVFIGAWTGGLAWAQHWGPCCLNETREPQSRVLWRQFDLVEGRALVHKAVQCLNK